MKKEDLVKYISEDTKVTKIQARKSIEVILNCITESLKADEKISFTGFGTFKVSHRKARNGFNPKSGEKIIIPATDVPVFKAGKTLKSFI